MDEVCNEFKNVVIRHIGVENINSIILIGGYGRGEGGVMEIDGEPHPHNNLDFQIILNKPRIGEFIKREMTSWPI